MDPMTMALIGGTVANLAGGIMGAKAQKIAAAEQRAMLEKAMAEFDAIGLPPDLSKRIIYEQFQQVGILEPEMEENIELAASAVSGLKEDPALKSRQMDVLSQIAQRGQVGLSPIERAEMNKVRQQVARDTEAKRAQILSEMAARGQAGGGMELISSLQAAQSGADVAAEQGDRLSAMAAQNALAALAQAGQLSSGIRGQDYQAELARRSAEDQFSLENWAQQNARQTRNVGTRNQAQAQNLANQQRIAEMNLAQENAERLRMEQAKRDYYQDRMNLAAGKAGMYQGQGQLAAQQGAAKAQMYQGIGSGLGSAAMAYGQHQTQQNQFNQQMSLAQQQMNNTNAYQKQMLEYRKAELMNQAAQANSYGGFVIPNRTGYNNIG